MLAMEKKAFLIFAVCCVSQVWCWAGVGSDAYRSPPARRNQCQDGHKPCYMTQECCPGFVCAAQDDIEGLKPDVPGYCVMEKHLIECVHNFDCLAGLKCVPLSRRDNKRFCVPMPASTEELLGPVASPQKAEAIVSHHKLNTDCDSNDDCPMYSGEGAPVCCVSFTPMRGRRTKKCEVVPESYVSKCSPAKNSHDWPSGSFSPWA